MVLRSLAARVTGLGLALAVAIGGTPAAFAQTTLPPGVESLRLAEPVTVDGADKLSPSLQEGSGRREVVIRMVEEPVATVARGGPQRQRAGAVSAQQDRVIARVQAADPSAVVLGRMRVTLNAVMMEVDGAALPQIARDVEIARINSVIHFERVKPASVMETVPYIGASVPVQNAGNRGAGVDVAVLDSGIDFTHLAFGGPGTAAAYAQAYCGSAAIAPNPTDPACIAAAAAPASPALFGPAAPSVKGGIDFVGEAWPNGDRTTDPNPIDFEGHGTSVADIIGGDRGVAPDVNLYGVKVCSAVSSSCNGVAILLGLEWAADPNSDGMTGDRMDVVNMSLGASYGQNYDDDSAAAVDALTAIGVLTVASAGNSADRPYISGTPAGARSALSVAQTAVPSDKVFPIRAGGTIVYGIAQPWAPEPAALIGAPLLYDTTNAGTRLGCSDAAGANPWSGTPLAGRIVLVDRGVCAVSLKSANAAAAGAVAVIIANNAAGTVPPSFSFGGGAQPIPALTVTQGAGLTLRPFSGQQVSIDGAAPISFAGSVVATSSRGPTPGQMYYSNSRNALTFGQLIKPEIGAPGASLSAAVRTGDGNRVFGGTSGAAPMVAGSAALLLNASGGALTPLELKNRLINTAERNIFNGPQVFGSGLAPITRIGGGEVRVDRAIAAQASAWEDTNVNAAISFGMVDVARKSETVWRRITIRNYGNTPLTYTLTPTFRFADDEASGAVTPSLNRSSITVPPRSQRQVQLYLTIDPARLPAWVLNSGSTGGNGDALTAVEFDGYLLLDTAGTANDIAMPWHVLPRASSDVVAPQAVKLANNTARLPLNNRGAGVANIEAFSLIGSSSVVTPAGAPGQQSPAVDLQHVGARAFDGTGVCPANSPLIQIAVNTHQRLTHANYPSEVDLFFDTNRDGVTDFIGYTAELSGFAVSGQNALFVGPVAGPFSAFFFTDHATNSANRVLTLCGSQIGVAALGQQINLDVVLFDNYFTGLSTSAIEGMSFVVGSPRFSLNAGDVPGDSTARATVTGNPAVTGTSETGILMLFDGVRGSARGGAVEGNEARAVIVR
jgi:subtilisin family serine protease